MQTRAQCKAEEKAEQQVEGTRQEEHVQPLHPDNFADATTSEHEEVVRVHVGSVSA